MRFLPARTESNVKAYGEPLLAFDVHPETLAGGG
jgi:hypothetical protein